MQKRRQSSIIGLVTAVAFAVVQVGTPLPALAASKETSPEVKVPSEFELNLPPDLGTIQSLNTGTGPTLIHLQDAHGNYEAQKKIEAILNYLKEKHGIKLILLEGSAHKLNPELVRVFPNRVDLSKKVADRLAKDAYAKAVELFLIDSPEIDVFGIENLGSYVANGRAFVEVLTQRERTDSFISDMDMQIERLTAPYLNKDLRAFLKRLEDFEAKRLPILDWLNYLKGQARTYLEIDLSDPAYQIDWPTLIRIFKLGEFESKLDMKAFAKERDEFLTSIRAFLVGADLRVRPQIDGSTHRSTPTSQDVYNQIKNLLTSPLSRHQLPDPETGILFEKMVASLPKDFNYDAYPNVKIFIGHLILQSEVKGERLMEEMNRLTDQISEKLAKTQEEKKILGLLKDHRLLKKLFALELSPEDYEIILSRHPEEPTEVGDEGSTRSFARPADSLRMTSAASLRPSSIISRFQSLNGTNRVRNIEFTHIDEINSLFEKALEFYQGVKERDEWMLRNIEARLKETGADKAVVITGGFHAEPFTSFFQKKNYNYALIAPKITTTEGREAYIESVLETRLSSTGVIRSTRMAEPYMGTDGATLQSQYEVAYYRVVAPRIMRVSMLTALEEGWSTDDFDREVSNGSGWGSQAGGVDSGRTNPRWGRPEYYVRLLGPEIQFNYDMVPETSVTEKTRLVPGSVTSVQVPENLVPVAAPARAEVRIDEAARQSIEQLKRPGTEVTAEEKFRYVRVLAEKGGPVVPALIDLLVNHPNAGRWALEALREIGPEAIEALPTLIDVIRGKFERLLPLNLVVEALIGIGPSAIPLLASALEEDKDSRKPGVVELRYQAINIFTQFGSAAIPTLEKFEKDSDPDFSAWAKLILAQILPTYHNNGGRAEVRSDNNKELKQRIQTVVGAGDLYERLSQEEIIRLQQIAGMSRLSEQARADAEDILKVYDYFKGKIHPYSPRQVAQLFDELDTLEREITPEQRGRLNEWQTDFLSDLRKWYKEEGKPLTPRQVDKLREILDLLRPTPPAPPVTPQPQVAGVIPTVAATVAAQAPQAVQPLPTLPTEIIQPPQRVEPAVPTVPVTPVLEKPVVPVPGPTARIELTQPVTPVTIQGLQEGVQAFRATVVARQEGAPQIPPLFVEALQKVVPDIVLPERNPLEAVLVRAPSQPEKGTPEQIFLAALIPNLPFPEESPAPTAVLFQLPREVAPGLIPEVQQEQIQPQLFPSFLGFQVGVLVIRTPFVVPISVPPAAFKPSVPSPLAIEIPLSPIESLGQLISALRVLGLPESADVIEVVLAVLRQPEKAAQLSQPERAVLVEAIGQVVTPILGVEAARPLLELIRNPQRAEVRGTLPIAPEEIVRRLQPVPFIPEIPRATAATPPQPVTSKAPVAPPETSRAEGSKTPEVPTAPSEPLVPTVPETTSSVPPSAVITPGVVPPTSKEEVGARGPITEVAPAAPPTPVTPSPVQEVAAVPTVPGTTSPLPSSTVISPDIVPPTLEPTTRQALETFFFPLQIVITKLRKNLVPLRSELRFAPPEIAAFLTQTNFLGGPVYAAGVSGLAPEVPPVSRFQEMMQTTEPVKVQVTEEDLKRLADRASKFGAEALQGTYVDPTRFQRLMTKPDRGRIVFDTIRIVERLQKAVDSERALVILVGDKETILMDLRSALTDRINGIDDVTERNQVRDQYEVPALAKYFLILEPQPGQTALQAINDHLKKNPGVVTFLPDFVDGLVGQFNVVVKDAEFNKNYQVTAPLLGELMVAGAEAQSLNEQDPTLKAWEFLKASLIRELGAIANVIQRSGQPFIVFEGLTRFMDRLRSEMRIAIYA